MTPQARGHQTSGTSPSPGFSRFAIWTPEDRPEGFVAVVALLVLAVYSMLLPAGKWEADEYVTSWAIANQGWHAVVGRVLNWSPRPFSKVLTWLYLSASLEAGRQLIAPFMVVLWAASLAGIAFSGWIAQVRRPVLLALLIFALSLLLAKPGEMFYWPQGAATYLPCWAGLAAATVLHRADLDRHRFALAVSLTLAALSAEVGALTVLLYVALTGAVAASERKLHRAGLLIVPALCGLAVCVLSLRGRMQAGVEVFDKASGLAGNWPGSLRALTNPLILI